MDTNYASNSHKSKEKQLPANQPKKEKVITGKATKKKKSEVGKLANSVITEDIANVKNYIVQDVLIPSFKKAISDIVTNGIDMLLYGETGVTKRSGGTSSRVSYRNYYDKGGDGKAKKVSSGSSYDFDEILVDSYAQADKILSEMDAQIGEFGSVTVADMYNYAGLEASWTDNKYGWTNINSAKADRTRDGKYIIKMPKASPL